LSDRQIAELYGITDGKAVGTYVEQAFNRYLTAKYSYTAGSAASGIDFPELEVDIKVTSIKQPQSSCPFRDASQKVYGLGYHLIVFAYEKIDNHESRAAVLNFQYAIFVDRERTGDYQTTYGLREIKPPPNPILSVPSSKLKMISRPLPGAKPRNTGEPRDSTIGSSRGRLKMARK